MFSKIKLYAILLIIVIVIGAVISLFLDNHSFVSNKFIKEKSDSIKRLKSEVIKKDSLLFDCYQTTDISEQQLREQQIVLAELKKQLIQAKNNCTQANEAIAHYEENGLMRFFVYEKNSWFQKGCYKEQFQKPDNICK